MCFLFYPFLGLQRTMPVQSVAGQHQESKTAAITPQSHPQNLTHSVQGAGRPRTARRLLPQPGRLVGAKCAGRWSGQLRISLECVHKSSECSNIIKTITHKNALVWMYLVITVEVNNIDCVVRLCREGGVANTISILWERTLKLERIPIKCVG